MAQQEMISAIVREVLAELGNGRKPEAAPVRQGDGHHLHWKTDYPLNEKRTELVKTAKGRSVDDITLDAVINGEITPDEIRITAQTLEYQAQIADSIGRPQLAANMRRAAELTKVSDDRVLEIYNALRPNRSSKQELLDIADELETKYGARKTAEFIREAAQVYEARKVLRKD